jgi:hypothetical protein
MGNPSLHPAGGDLIAVSYMAGDGSDVPWDHDAMDGVDWLVLGHADATRELAVDSATGGTGSGPLRVEPEESVYSDDHLLGTHDMRIDAGQAGDDCDWCAELRLWEHEP